MRCPTELTLNPRGHITESQPNNPTPSNRYLRHRVFQSEWFVISTLQTYDAD
ncbi:hypothetical protein COLO4_31823 [Corchorus olitorius]|uniref:Uncharacterized protein n=1 Tax=Corchorus olitorius TaxID=93759 RepID=A0A1R3H343_9ROSI|nr:hypothetical protein COLO4_31823 [Corchorus olitorius]